MSSRSVIALSVLSSELEKRSPTTVCAVEVPSAIVTVELVPVVADCI